MQTLLKRKRVPLMAWLCGMALALLVSGCGGGGGGASSSSGGSGTSSSTSVVTLSGVAAHGAPLIGATISVIDATGTSQGSTLASLVSGEYQLPLSSPTAKFPLLVQAAGVDMAGNPLVLYTVVLSGTPGQTSVAHITPLTNAVVAMLLGGDPRTRFANPSSIDATTWARLGNSAAVTAANNFLLTVITSNLSGVKPTALNKATLNIFSDPNFHADKTGVDALIDGLRVQIGKDVVGNDVLRLSNSLILAGSSEVVVNLNTAKIGLSQATPAITGAITSSRITTTNSTTIAHVADLATLQSRINDLLAVPGVTASSFNPNSLSRAPIVSASYNYFNGLDWGGLIDQLVAYGAAGYQLSSFQVSGCLDDPVPAGGCAKVRITSLLRSSSTGQIMQMFENVVSWSSTAGWTFVGNNFASSVNLYPVVWQQWTSAGVASGGAGQGLQVDMFTISNLLSQFPPRLGLPNPNSSARSIYVPASGSGALLFTATETGDLVADQVLAVTQSGPLSPSDVVSGAQFKLTSTAFLPFPNDPVLGQTVIDKVDTVRLVSDLPVNVTASAYPMMDNITRVPLTSIAMTNGLSFSWNTWAAANPHMRMVEVRAVITSTASAPVKQVVTLIPMSATQLTLSSFAGLVPADAIQFTLWLIAQDDQGRRYVSKIVADS